MRRSAVSDGRGSHSGWLKQGTIITGPDHRRCRLTECSNRFEQKAPVADQSDAEVLESSAVSFGNIRMSIRVVAECRLVLLKFQLSQEIAFAWGALILLGSPGFQMLSANA